MKEVLVRLITSVKLIPTWSNYLKWPISISIRWIPLKRKKFKNGQIAREIKVESNILEQAFVSKQSIKNHQVWCNQKLEGQSKPQASILRGRSQTTLIKFCPFLTTYLALVDICGGIPLLLTENQHTVGICTTTCLPCLVNVVCEWPPIKSYQKWAEVEAIISLWRLDNI